MNNYVKFVSPFFIFTVSIVISSVYKKAIIHYPFEEKRLKAGYGLIGAILGLVSIALCYEELRLIFISYSDPIKYSDVLPQIEVIYDRFSKGEFPYYPIPLPTHSPFPVYFPFTWLPLGITRYFGIDTRWIGIIFLGIAVAIYSWYVFRREANILLKMLLVFLPSIALWAAIIPAHPGLPITLETVIAAYYLILAVGLASKNLPLTIIGIILCLLSRYTLVFWMPLFAYLLWFNTPKKTSFITWGIVVLAVIVTLVPFYAGHVDSFIVGLRYHNSCSIAEMQGYGNPPVSWSYESGIYFGPHFQALLGGDASTKVSTVRGIQTLLMIVLNIAGIIGYRKLQGKVDFYQYSLMFLYLIVFSFYMISPHSYWYYFIPIQMMTAVLIAEICIVIYNKKIQV